jgi:hypothetical protein
LVLGIVIDGIKGMVDLFLSDALLAKFSRNDAL